jgi:pilus assembly protein Flp/PilA
MMKVIKMFLKDEEGVTAIEYALIAAGIATVIILVVLAVGQKLIPTFQSVVDGLAAGS